jgi:hypothetical protein
LNIVHRDGAWSQIDCSTANKSYERSLGHAVDTCTRKSSADSGIAADEHDPASVFHLLGGCLNTNEGGTDVDSHHAVEVFETIGIDRASGKNASAADENV